MSSATDKIELGPVLDANRVPRYTSVSQLQTAERCQRRWYYRYVEGIKFPPNKKQLLGIALHDEWHAHFTRGEALGPLAMSGFELKPTGNFTSETPTMWINKHRMIESLVTVDGTPLVGYIDIMARKRVVDIKTTSDEKWAKTPDQLAGDIQMIGYALHNWASNNSHRDPMEVAHWYFKTKGKPKSWIVESLVEPDRAIAEWARTTPIMQTIRAAAAIGPGRADDVPGNPHACGDFRGCDYRDRCSVGASSLLDTMFAADESALIKTPNPEPLEEPSTMSFFNQPPPAPAMNVPAMNVPAMQPPAMQAPAMNAPAMQAPVAFGAPPPQAHVAPAVAPALSPEAQESLQRFRTGGTDQALEAAQVGFLMRLIETANYGTPPLNGALAFAWCRHMGQPETPNIAGTRAMQTLERPVESIADLKELVKQLGRNADERAHFAAQLENLPSNVPTIAPQAAPAFTPPQAPAEPAPVAFGAPQAQIFGGVLPPDAPPQSEKKRGRPATGKAKKAAEGVESDAPIAYAMTGTDQMRDPVVEGHAAAPADVLPNAAVVRDPRYTNQQRYAEVQATAAYNAADVAATRATLASPQTPPTFAGGLVLFIDCLPTDGDQPQPLYEYVNEAMAALAKLAKLDDIRLADKNSAFAYGGWKAALQALVVKQPPPNGRWFIDTRGNEPNEIVAMALINKAAQATRGLR